MRRAHVSRSILAATFFMLFSVQAPDAAAQQVIPPSSNGFEVTITAAYPPNIFFPGFVAMWDYDPNALGGAINQPATGDISVQPMYDFAVNNCYYPLQYFSLLNACASRPAGRYANPIIFTVDPVDPGKTYVFGTEGYVYGVVTYTITVTDNGTTSTVTRTALPAFSGGTIPFFSYTPHPRQGVFTFDLTAAAGADPNQARLLTHVYRHDVDGNGQPLPGSKFFSNSQIQSTSSRPQMKIEGTVSNAPSTNRIWFKLADPPDPSSYVVQGNDSHAGDNQDGASLKFGTAQVNLAPGTTSSAALQASWDIANHVHLILEGSDHVSGDNYKVIASFDAPNATTGLFPCEVSNTCTASPIITTWKRIYLERDHMFRHGTFVTRGRRGDSDVYVRDVSQLGIPGRTIDIRMIHAPDVVQSGPTTDSFYSEDFHGATIVGVTTLPSGQMVPAHIQLPPNATLAHMYGKDFSDNNPIEMPILADAIGVIGTVSDFFDGPGIFAHDSTIDATFGAAYVDIQDAPQDVAEVPYVPRVPGWGLTPVPHNGERVFANKWLENGTPVPGSTDRPAFPNHQHLIGGASGTLLDDIGVTWTRQNGNHTWIWVASIEHGVTSTRQLNGLDPLLVILENVAHELAHQWRVNEAPWPGGADAYGHCQYSSYLHSQRYCRMYVPFDDSHNSERGDGLVEFHYEHDPQTQHVSSEYLVFRQAAEPLPNN